MNTAEHPLGDTLIADGDEIFASLFTLDLGDGGVDFGTVERIHAGDFDEWIEAAARSGLFTRHDVEALVRSWERSPKSLFDALLSDVDEVTRHRYTAVWDALDNLTTFETAEYA
ncbi:hypothetical protein BFN03_18240 [Rhodococcus sp. WMMA185]|uniref:hypothetical protein n=1 Tax=Rhodococcus sp. WMMA185 TaxID=679318 RepID=UPI0008782DC4|nr:hypothetical protein [Rhodococcus sp. WMMA185]AOW93944.1 hypothetical protein BFN03_18240 [Rhodococcus sp. WMMA185]